MSPLRSSLLARSPRGGARRIAVVLLIFCIGGSLHASTQLSPSDRTLSPDYIVDTWTTRQGLPQNMIRAVRQTRDGHLWIGTASAGLVRFDGVEFVTFDVTNTPALPSNGITALYEDVDGVLWIGTYAGLATYRLGTFAAAGDESMRGGEVTAITADASGRIWVAGDVFLVRQDGDRWTTVVRQPDAARINDFLVDDTGVAWLASDGGLFVAAPDGVTVATFADAPSSPAVLAIRATSGGAIVVGTDRGLAHVDARTRRLVPQPSPFGSAPVTRLFEDRDGALWVASQGRLVRRSRDGVVIAHDVAPPSSGAQVSAIVEDRDGQIWLGLEAGAGGLIRLRRRLVSELSQEDGLPCDNIGAVTEQAGGTLWISPWCLDGAGVAAIRDGRETHGRRTRVGEAEGLSNHGIRTIVDGEDDTLWVGTEGGVHHYANGRFTNYEDPDWKGRSPVRAVHVDGDGHVWVGTYGSGLCRLADGRFYCFGTLNALLDTSVHRLIEDENGFLWMSGDHGIRRARLADLEALADGRAVDVHVVLLDEADGLSSAEANGMAQPAGWASNDGALHFPTQRGLVRIDRRAIGERPPAPLTAVVRDVRVDGAHRATRDAMVVAAGTHEIEFSYGAPSLTRPDRVRFRYRLEGYDADWVDAGAERRAQYRDLPAGSYRFNLSARAGSGLWSDAPGAVTVSVEPRLFERPATRLAVALALLAMAGAWWRWRGARRPATEVEGKELRSMKREVDRAGGQLRAALGQIDVPALVLDGAGIVQHANEPAHRLLAPGQEALEGRRWDECLAIAASDRSRVKSGINSPGPGEKIPTQIAVGKQRFWMSVDVRAAGSPGEGCLVYLHDVTPIAVDLRGERHEGQFGLIGRSSPMYLLYKQIRDVARVDATVLIEGETGSGKELVARAIHRGSARAAKPFIAVNAAGLAEPILASQLFGHRRGAFTGAVADQMGLFEAASGGTLFLDEIGDVPLAVQTSLLRVLQEREVTRVGDARPTQLDVRFLAATHRDLKKEVEAGRFREDLLYRIRVTVVHVPPLRARGDDVPLLVDAFVTEAARLAGRAVPRVSHDAMDALTRCRWPGNVRQLKSAIDHAVIANDGPILRVEHLPPDVLRDDEDVAPADERARLLDALRRANGNRNEAARLLGIGRATLYRKLAAHGIRAGRVSRSHPLRPDETA